MFTLEDGTLFDHAHLAWRDRFVVDHRRYHDLI
jgi:hypothetical protein